MCIGLYSFEWCVLRVEWESGSTPVHPPGVQAEIKFLCVSHIRSVPFVYHCRAVHL